jgi:Ankyrin repeats (many copies)
VFGRKEATATTEDATKALYVHLAFDGGIFVVRGDGRQAWMTQTRLDDELVELRASGGRLIYSRDDPEHEPSEHVNDVFKRIVDSRPAGIQLLEVAHPVAAAHGKQDVTMLMIAAHRGEIGLLTDLIARHVPLEARSNKGYTALMLAANSGKVECTRLLLDANADPNARDHKSSTPLMFAAQRGFEEIVRMLLENGADRSASGDHGRTAADLARQNGHQATVSLLDQFRPA